MKLQYRVGDATQPVGEGTKIITHCCNNVGAWGAGFVLAISRRWPEPEVQYKSLFPGFKDDYTPTPELGFVQYVPVEDDTLVANIIGQVMGGPHPVRYDALYEGLSKVHRHMQIHSDPISLHMPRMGSALAGGSWDVVEAIVNEVFEETPFAVTCYDLQPVAGTEYVP